MLPWVRRKRAESPSPILAEMRTSFARGTAPGMPTWMGRCVPRRHTSFIHATVTRESKQIWLTMYVANLALSNIAWIVVSSGISRVALRVPGDADVVERVAELRHRLQQRCGAVERSGGLRCVARDHEHVAHAGCPQPGHDLRKVRTIGHEPGRDVRRNRIAVAGQPVDEIQRVSEPATRRDGDGQLHVVRHVLEHLLLDPVEREHLVARPAEELGQAHVR